MGKRANANGVSWTLLQRAGVTNGKPAAFFQY